MRYGIRMTYTGTIPPTPSAGWVLDGRKPAEFDTQEDAEREARRLRRDGRYTWNGCKLETTPLEGKR